MKEIEIPALRGADGAKLKRAGVHTDGSPAREPSFNRKNGAPVLKGNHNLAQW
jgi:hypothetical protein